MSLCPFSTSVEIFHFTFFFPSNILNLNPGFLGFLFFGGGVPHREICFVYPKRDEQALEVWKGTQDAKLADNLPVRVI